jgi:DNA primase
MTILNVYDLAQQDTQLRKVSHKEYAGPCPRCKGNDRFHIQPYRREGGAWMCRNCWPADEHGWGDAIEYLRQMRAMSFKEAKAFVEGEEVESTPAPVSGPSTLSFESPVWQERAAAFAKAAETRLWTDEGKAALDYLHGRGLLDETIRKAHLGYALWNGIPCVVFPWYADKRYYRIQMRDIRPDTPKDERYRMYPGSSNSGLYLSDSLKLDKDTFIVEGEIDALSIAQEVDGLFAVVATGTTKGSRSLKWKAQLSRVPHVFVAYDREQTGNKDSTYWLEALPNAIRWRPTAHDANDMLTSGVEIVDWAFEAIAAAYPRVQHDEQALPIVMESAPIEETSVEEDVAWREDFSDFPDKIYTDDQGVTWRISLAPTPTLGQHVQSLYGKRTNERNSYQFWTRDTKTSVSAPPTPASAPVAPEKSVVEVPVQLTLVA